ncbi:hypothetical protein T265_02320 [Opisthorchis viverrini]|uniref:Uncharacterized protein n=1 Tax=Opisthorchis viverrini TaxID=6198 RepID=A0A074ZW95_OPIVI|nr:hypothetical protein T265_02320 [Opisthorchis viverrini]KER31406.1 hypothetical protein T265_02320 [Opisthorchis viverrini]
MTTKTMTSVKNSTRIVALCFALSFSRIASNRYFVSELFQRTALGAYPKTTVGYTVHFASARVDGYMPVTRRSKAKLTWKLKPDFSDRLLTPPFEADGLD